MKAKLTVKLGNKTFAVEGDGKARDIVKNLAFWSQLPTKCGECGKENISFFSREATSKKTQRKCTYSGLQCNDCTAELTFHVYNNETQDFYLTSEDKWTVWRKKSTQSNDEPPPFDRNEDIPF